MFFVRISGYFLSEIRDVLRRLKIRDGYWGGFGNFSSEKKKDNKVLWMG